MHFMSILSYMFIVVVVCNHGIRIPWCFDENTTPTPDNINDDERTLVGLPATDPNIGFQSFTDREYRLQECIGEKLPRGATITDVRTEALKFVVELYRSPTDTTDINLMVFSVALKHYSKLTDFLAQLNSLVVLDKYDYPMKFMDAIRGTPPLVDYNDIYYNATSKKGDFCLIMPRLKGTRLDTAMKKRIFGDSRIYESKFYIYKILILILRDVQLLHFSFNQYPIYENAPIYGRLSYTLYHGDLLRTNIMVVDSNDRTLPKRPVLFDVGFHLSFIITLKNDLIIQFYNKYLLQKYLPLAHREELSVDRRQIMNLMQQIDFCMFLALLLDFFYNVDDVVEYPMEICLKVMKFTDQDRRPYRRQNISNVDGPLKDIVMILLTFNMPFLTYEQTWLKLYNFMYRGWNV
ncbi:hypothetical protein SNEBB_009021 [Seison nebaliae]|nr:hypothetical protein SNEBB_009021 [Seison nebaliae]